MAAAAQAAGYAVASSKAQLFETSDVLSLHVRLTKETHGIVGPDDLETALKEARLNEQ